MVLEIREITNLTQIRQFTSNQIRFGLLPTWDSFVYVDSLIANEWLTTSKTEIEKGLEFIK